jgi:membrane protein DedA with SNARE-associated domain
MPVTTTFLGELQQLVSLHGYWVIGLIVGLESLGLPLPGETILVLAAIYAATEPSLNIWVVIAVAAFGAIIGDNIGYWFGSRYGYALLLRYGERIGMFEPRIKLGQYLFLRHGAKVVFLGRFVALLRILAAFLAGLNRMPWRAFLMANACPCSNFHKAEKGVVGLLPPGLCRRRRPSTCAGIGLIRPRLAAIGTSANSSTGSHDLPRSSGRTLAVNLRAVFFVLQGAAKRMREQTLIAGSELRGKLIQTASIAAYRGGQAYMVHYAASKAGVVSVTRTAAQVLAAYRITSNCVCPGAVDTPMWRKIDAEWSEIEGWRVGEAWKRRTSLIPLGRPETPEDVAGVVSARAAT